MLQVSTRAWRCNLNAYTRFIFDVSICIRVTVALLAFDQGRCGEVGDHEISWCALVRPHAKLIDFELYEP